MRKIILMTALVAALFITSRADSYSSDEQLSEIESTYGDRASSRLKTWNSVMKKIANEEPFVQVRHINALFNRYGYRSDAYNWQSEEHWASFKEFIGKGRGDCEDYAFAKYYSLRKLGIPASKLKLMSGKFAGKGHLLLVYYKESNDPYVLDKNSRYLVRLSKNGRFKPETYFNESSYGVMDKSISQTRARAEYELFQVWLEDNN